MTNRALVWGSLLLLVASGCPGDDATTTTTNATPTSSTGDLGTTEAFDTEETEGPPATTTDTPETSGTGTTGNGGMDSTGTPSGCAGPGSASTIPSMVDDMFGHLLFLWLFGDPDAMDASQPEEIVVTNDGTNIGFAITARDAGSGSGHMGLAEVSGPIDPNDCSFDITGTVPYASDTGDFGDVTVQWTGVAAPAAISVNLSLSGGGIPSGPIIFGLDFTPM